MAQVVQVSSGTCWGIVPIIRTYRGSCVYSRNPRLQTSGLGSATGSTTCSFCAWLHVLRTLFAAEQACFYVCIARWNHIWTLCLKSLHSSVNIVYIYGVSQLDRITLLVVPVFSGWSTASLGYWSSLLFIRPQGHCFKRRVLVDSEFGCGCCPCLQMRVHCAEVKWLKVTQCSV